MEKIVDLESLFEFILSADYIKQDAMSGGNIDIPIYDITAEQFLEFAKNAISFETKESIVNAVSNLKRAIDCEMDLFFESMNIKRIFDKNNLKFEIKSKFFLDAGLLPTHSINKLNTIRNKLEHEYQMPQISDVRTYYELAWDVVKIIELYLELIYTNGEINMSLEKGRKKYYLIIGYDVELCGFIFEIYDWTEGADRKEKQITVYLKNKSDYDSFIKAFRFYLFSIKFFNLGNVELYKKNIKKLKI